MARSLAQVPLSNLWEIKLPAPVHGSWLSRHIPDLLIIQFAGSHALWGVSASSGAVLWQSHALSTDLGSDPATVRTSTQTTSGAQVHDDRIYVLDRDVLLCLDGRSGAVIWRFYLPFSPASGPAVHGSVGDLSVVLADWKKRVQIVGIHADTNRPYVKWRHGLEAVATASATIDGGQSIVVDHAGTVSCFGLERNLIWETRIGGLLWNPALATGKLLVVGTDDHALVALDRYAGEELGRIYLDAPITRTPFVFQNDPGLVYAWSDRGHDHERGLWGLEIRRDEIKLSSVTDARGEPTQRGVVRMAKRFFVPGASRLVGSTPTQLLVMNDAGSISAIDRQTGVTQWRWAVTDDGREPVIHVTTYLDPTDQVRTVFLADAGQRLTAYRFFGGDDLSVSAPAAGAPIAPPAAPRH